MDSRGIRGGFQYKTVPHVTLKSIANNPDIREGMTKAQIDVAIAKHAQRETLYDQPEIDRSKVRVTGPFTVEAVPPAGAGVPEVRPIDEIDAAPTDGTDAARTGATLRQDEWRDELLAAGVRAKSGQRLTFARLEPLAGTRHIHAVGETDEETPKRVVVSFGPEHAPLEQRQVEQAWDEARSLRPKPDVLLFAAFQFDPEAAKDIDELSPEKAGMLLLKSQMNADLLTDDLKKKRGTNESFWLIGQPDVDLRIVKGERGASAPRGSAPLHVVEVRGFDYYNPKTGTIDSGGADKIAMWMLDPDYDGRSVYPRQVFFPMAGDKEGWARLVKDLKAEIDEDLIESYRGTVSLPFAAGEHRRVAVKIVDDRGIESLKVLPLDEA
jgi:adenine-specific DNA-methyltransferase